MRKRTKAKILIVADRVDLHADHMIEALEDLNEEVVRWNIADTSEDANVSWAITGNSDSWQLSLKKAQHSLSSQAIKSALYRQIRYSTSVLEENFEPTLQSFISNELREFVGGVLRQTDTYWINDPKALTHAFWRLPQIALARQLGLQVPKTIVTNSRDEVCKFIGALGEKDICLKRLSNKRTSKPIGLGVWTKIVPRNDYEKLYESISVAPTMIQEYIQKKKEVRLVLVGNESFCSIIHSQDCPEAVEDWRKGQLHGLKQEPGILPESLISKCRQLLDRLGLVFGAFDFILTPNDEYIFLEVNPTGQWLWMETDLNLPISKAFAKLLANPPELSNA